MMDLPVNHIEEAWDKHSVHRELKEACNNIEFPVFPSLAIASGKHWTNIGTIEFHLGGSSIKNVWKINMFSQSSTFWQGL